MRQQISIRIPEEILRRASRIAATQTKTGMAEVRRSDVLLRALELGMKQLTDRAKRKRA